MKTVLVAVLDWGLGHATRTIPVIRELMKQDVRVLVAGNGSSWDLLKQEFPDLKFYELPGYDIQYDKEGNIAQAIVKQLPRLKRVIKAEFKSVSGIVDQESVDAIISDNRYGCYHPSIPSVMICHQLNLKMPDGLRWMKFFVDAWHGIYLKRFNEIWIPDMPDASLSFSGDLSKTGFSNAKRIGILSRFEDSAAPKKSLYDIVALISGPEPQRSIFETIIRRELLKFNGKALMVNGQPQGEPLTTGAVVEMNHLKASELDSVLRNTKVIVARSGYSTIMDLAALGQRAILVPTPGQTEQEYLAKHLAQCGWIVTQNQNDFNLMEALDAVKKINTMPHVSPNSFLPQAITDLLRLC
jgi:uncharacterized protein (TIGR00661 family)